MNGDHDKDHLVPMSEGLRAHTVLRPVDMDEWSSVRSVLAAALASGAGFPVDSPEWRAIHDAVFTPEYTDTLLEQQLWVADWQGHVVGVCGWLPADDTGSAARIVSLGIAPLFAHLGFGRLLLENAEQRAAAAGYHVVTTRVPSDSAGFYLEQGYELTAFGTQSMTPAMQVHVAFMRKLLGQNRRSGVDAATTPGEIQGGTFTNPPAETTCLDG